MWFPRPFPKTVLWEPHNITMMLISDCNATTTISNFKPTFTYGRNWFHCEEGSGFLTALNIKCSRFALNVNEKHGLYGGRS